MSSPLTLYPSKSNNIPLLLVSLLFTAIPWLIEDAPWYVWTGSAFFTLCALVFLITLIPGSSYLRLTEQGFVVRSLYRTWPLTTHSVSEFSVADVSRQRLVIYDSSVDSTQSPRLSGFNRWLTGSSSGLPDTYGLTPEALAALMNEWRQRHSVPQSS